MKWQNIKAKELHGLIDKISLEPTKSKRRSPHPIYWYKLDGKRTLRLKLPNISGGSGSVSKGFLQNVKNNLRLKNREFEDLVECPLTSEEFEGLVRERQPHR